MIVLRRIGRVLLLVTALSLTSGCEFLVAPTPFGAPADSAGDRDDTGPAAPNEPTTGDDVSGEPGITINPTTIGATEGGPDGSYEVVLTAEPTADVTVSPSATNGEVTATPTSLIFTVGNWDTLQTVTIAAVDDAIAEGSHSDTVIHDVTSEDVDYEGITAEDVAVSIVDNDVPATAEIILAHAGVNLLVVEGGPNETVSVSLNSEPTGTVSVTLNPGARLDLGSGAGAPITQNFPPADWNVPWSVAVSAVNDVVVGAFTDTISVTTTSPDPEFDALSSSAPVLIEDDERPDTIYVVSNNLLYRLDDMGGSNQVTYDGSAGTTAFTSGLNNVWVDGTQIYTVDGTTDLAHRFDDMAGLNPVEYDGTGAGGTAFTNPQGIAVFGAQIYVSDFGTNRVYRFDDMPTPTVQDEYDGGGAGGTPFVDPLRTYVDASGIYVVDFGTNLLYRFDDMPSPTVQDEYDGSGATAFQNPRDVAVDSLGRIYVVDRVNKVVQRIDDMTGLNAVEYDGSAGTPFDNPVGIWIDGDDRIYVVDSFTASLYRFDDMTGTNQVEYTVPGFVSNVFVVD